MRYSTRALCVTPRAANPTKRSHWVYLRRLATAVLFGVLTACGTVDTDPLTAEDTPVLQITVAGAATVDVTAYEAIPVTGMITASVEAPSWLGYVTFRWNEGRTSLRVTSAPFETSIDSAELDDGQHTIYADLHQRNGRVRATVEARVAVVNDEPAIVEPSPGDGEQSPPATEPPTESDPPVEDAPEGDEPTNPSSDRLTWAPPALESPITVNVPVTGGVLTLDPSRDYRLVMPDQPVTGPLAFNGGRNVVLVGGEINIGWQGSDATYEAKRRGMFIRNSTGVVHIEGLLMHGDDIGEGFHISAPDATVQIQNVRVWGIHARDDVGFTDGHPDLIQTWGNVGSLRVDGLTGSSNYQGIFLKADFNGQHGPVDLRRVNVHGDATSRYLFWMSDMGGDYPTVRLEDMYIDYAASRSMSNAVWPDARNADDPASIKTVDGRFEASWPSLPVTGVITSGAPPAGDFVGPDDAGIDYVTPGYN